MNSFTQYILVFLAALSPMIITTQNPNVKIPKSVYSDLIPDPKLNIPIFMDASGQITCGEKSTHMDGLEEFLVNQYKQYPEISKKHILCMLYADAATPLKNVDALREELKRLGMSKIIYAVKNHHAASAYSNTYGIKMPLDVFDTKAHDWVATQEGRTPKKFVSVIAKSAAPGKARYAAAPVVYYKKRKKLEGRGANEVFIKKGGNISLNGEEIPLDLFEKEVYNATKQTRARTSFSIDYDASITYGEYINALGGILGGVHQIRNEVSLRKLSKKYKDLGRRERTPILNEFPLLLFDYSFVEKAFYKF